MSNINYRSIHINNVEVDKLKRRVCGEPLAIGIDVAKNDFKAVLGRKDGQSYRIVEWEHPFETRQFIQLVNSLGASEVEIVMEPTGTYQEPVRYQAYEEGWEVYSQSPNRVHDAAEVYDGVPSKHDAKDGKLLLWLHGQGLSSRWEPTKDRRRRLKVLTDRMANLELQFQRFDGRLEAKLARHWPEVSSGWDITSATLLRILEEFGSPVQVANRAGEAAARMKEIGGHFLSQKRVNQVIAWAKQTVGDSMLIEEREMLKQLAGDADRIRKRKRELEGRLKSLIRDEKQFEVTRKLAEEVGATTAAVFRVKVGDFREYDVADALLKAFGLNLKENSSGQDQGPLKITKRGSSKARRFLYLAALRKINQDPIFEAWHEKKVKRDGGVKLKSIVALMRKYVQGLWHVARGYKFDSHKLFDTSRLEVA